MIFNFQYTTKGLNSSGGLMRSHWAMQQKLKEKILQDTVEQLDGVFSDKVVITYRRGYKSRPLDRDNLYSSAKFFIDALVNAGVIKDDSEDHVDLRCDQFQTSRPITSIEIYESSHSF